MEVIFFNCVICKNFDERCGQPKLANNDIGRDFLPLSNHLIGRCDTNNPLSKKVSIFHLHFLTL